jgi:hypothetical protein
MGWPPRGGHFFLLTFTININMDSLGPPNVRIAIIGFSTVAIGLLAHIMYLSTHPVVGQKVTLNWSSYLLLFGALFAFIWNTFAVLMEKKVIRKTKASIYFAVPH